MRKYLENFLKNPVIVLQRVIFTQFYTQQKILNVKLFRGGQECDTQRDKYFKNLKKNLINAF